MQTHQFKLEFIFGKGISSFPPGTVPIEADLVRRWVFEYDRMRGDRIRPGEAFQHEVISSVVDELIDFWKANNSGQPIRPRWKVFTKVKDFIVGRVEPLFMFIRQRNEPEQHAQWIANILSSFVSKFDISATSPDPAEKRVPKKSKRFVEEDPDYPGPSSKRSFVEAEEISESDSDYSDDLSEEISGNNKCTVYYKNVIAMIQRINNRGGNISLGNYYSNHIILSLIISNLLIQFETIFVSRSWCYVSLCCSER